jgi:hypothetical protein
MPVSSRGHIRTPKKSHCGQNLVELMFTLPFMLLLVFFVIDLGRAWRTYEGAKTAVRSANYTASIYHSADVGQAYLDHLLSATGVFGSGKVTQLPNQHAYQSSVKVTFKPLFAELSIPTLSGPIPVFPAAFEISYSGVTDVSVY